MNKTDNKLKKEITSWLQRFAEMVRSKKYTDAEEFFDKNTFGFGTIAALYSNLAEYETKQWKECWGTTKDFEFDYSTLQFITSDDKSLIVIGIMWKSIGVKPDGSEFPREGRTTTVLKRDKKTGSLISVHNHYSRVPKNFPDDF